MIEPIKDIDYTQPFMTNELNKRGADQASEIVKKMNEMIAEINRLGQSLDMIGNQL